MDVQRVAKIVLDSPRGIILPYGESGRLNLPGGGIRLGEMSIDALARELEEELGLPIDEVGPRWVGEQRFHTTTRTGIPQIRHWDIFMGSTELEATDFMYGGDIRGVESLSDLQIYRDKRVNYSAKVATALSRRALRR